MGVPIMELQNFQIYLLKNLLNRILDQSLREYQVQKLLTSQGLKDPSRKLYFQELIGNENMKFL